VTVLHVLERSLLDALRSPGDRDRIRAERRELLTEFEAMGEDRGVETESQLLEGNPAAQITSLAADREHPVIVLGRQGRSTVSRKILGGVTEKVIEAGVAPVLVEPGTDPAETGFAPSRVLVPTDGSENAEAAFPPAARLAAEVGASVHVLAILDLQRAGGVFNAGGLDAEFVDRLEAQTRTALESGEQRLRDLDSDLAVTTDLERSSDFDGVSGGIESYAESREVDLIVMGSHGRSNVSRQVLGSVTATVLRNVDVPVLVVPRGQSER
jgi:nucleotide-binding universal stress UspA family protein